MSDRVQDVPRISPGPRGRISYLPGLDGIRAIAVLAIIAYHSGFSWITGGFYSVDTFFTLSGFLITTLLIAEWSKSTTISLSNFWIRRARRLLPGLFVMLVGLGLATLVFPGALASSSLKSDSIATLFYYANWHFIFAHANYFFVTSKPSALLHTWTLAIEEQFYIVWPLIVTGVLIVYRRSNQWSDRPKRARLKALLSIGMVGSVASAVLMAILYHPGSDPTRVYYGTDTRAQSLLIGASLAVVLELWPLKDRPRGPKVIGLLGIVGVFGTGIIWSMMSESSPFAFRGGFFVASVLSACVIGCVSQLPEHPITRVLGFSPLTYLGKISYGVYLWYWPTLLVINTSYTSLSGLWLFMARLATVIALAAASYYLVECKIRAGAIHGLRAPVAVAAGIVCSLVSIFVTSAYANSSATATVSLTNNSAYKNSVDLPLAQGSGRSIPRASTKLKVLLVGDSMAGTLGVGLQDLQGSYNVQLVNQGSPGCSLAMDGDFKVLWYTSAPGKPCQANQPQVLLDTWQAWVNRFNPDVVIYFARADLMDQSIGGTWERIGQGNFDRYLTQRFQAALSVLTSRGAHIILISSPYYNSGTQPSGQGWPEDNPSRVVAYNKLLEGVARNNPGKVSYLDLNGILAPSNSFTSSYKGLITRCNDGVHLTPLAGKLVSKQVFQSTISLGESHASSSPGGTWPNYKPGPPSWYSQLHCLGP